MPRKNVIAPISIITAGDMSQATLTSSVTNLQYLDNVGIQFIFTGSPTGTFSVEVSNDNSNWTALSLSPTPAATGSAGNQYVDLNQLSAAWIRAKYTKSSGTGSLTALLTAKEI